MTKLNFLQFTNHLESFGVDVKKDLVAVTGDGAAVMLKFGRLLGVPYLLCLNHTINLAVTDKLFEKKTCEEANLSADYSSNDSDEDEEADDSPNILQPINKFEETIKKMRDIIKIFRYSPLKAGILEEIQKKNGKKPLKLIVDCTTRWNSLVISGNRFLEILPYVDQAMKHKEIRSNILWNDHNTEILQVFLNRMAA